MNWESMSTETITTGPVIDDDPTIAVGSRGLPSRYFLAPLAGYTHLAFRVMLRRLGGVGLAFELAVRASGSWAFRGACAIALGAGLTELWINAAVGIVGDAFRPGQRVKITSLQDLQKEAESVDMVTIVVIGNSTTYLHGGRVITPRGYEKKTKAS